MSTAHARRRRRTAPQHNVQHLCTQHACMQNMQAEMGLLREKAEKDRAKARAALASVAQVSDENRRLREANPDAVALLESSYVSSLTPLGRPSAALGLH